MREDGEITQIGHPMGTLTKSKSLNHLQVKALFISGAEGRI